MPDYTVNQAIITDSPPAENLLKDGDHLFYLDGENLVELIKANGVLFEDVVGADSSEPEATGTSNIGNFTALDSGLYAGSLQLLSGPGVLVSTDSGGFARAKFGQVVSDSFGFQVLKTDGATEIMGFYGNTANISGWTVDDDSIEKTVSSKTLRLTTAGTPSTPSLVVLISSLEKVRIGLLDSTNTGILIKDGSGGTLMQISGGSTDVAKIAGWHFTDTILKSTATNATAHLKLDSSKMRVSIMDDVGAGADKIAMGYLEGLVKNKSLGRIIDDPQEIGGKAVITLADVDEEEDEDAMRTNTLVGLHYWASINTAGSTTGITQTAGIPVESNTHNTITLVTGGTNAYAMGYDSAYAFLAAVYDGEGGHAQGRYYKLLFQSDDYGFWAKDGDQLRIDGDVVYDSGDWLISSDGSIKFYSAGTEVMRLGTHGANRGLFIGDGITNPTINARFTSGGFVIGDVDGTANRIEWTGSALNILGTMTVQDGILPSLAKAEINKSWSGVDATTVVSSNGDAVLYGYSGDGTTSAGIEASFMYQGSKYYIERWQGWTTNTGGTAEKTIRTIGTKAPASGTQDSYIVYETAGGTNGQPTTAAGNAPFEMTGETGDPFYRIVLATRTTTVSSAGVISVVWKYDPNSNTLTTFTPTATMVVIGYCRTYLEDEIIYMQLFREAQPIDVVVDIAGWDTSNFNADGTSATLTTGVTITGGGITMSSGGSIKGGQSDYNTSTGFFLGYSGGAYKFSIGNTSTENITWDGSTMSIRGSLNADDISAGTMDASLLNVREINATGDNLFYTPLQADHDGGTNLTNMTNNGWYPKVGSGGTWLSQSSSGRESLFIQSNGDDGDLGSYNSMVFSNYFTCDPQTSYELSYDVRITDTDDESTLSSEDVSVYVGLEGYTTTNGNDGTSGNAYGVASDTNWKGVDKDGALGSDDANFYLLIAKKSYGNINWHRFRHMIYGIGTPASEMLDGGNIVDMASSPWTGTSSYTCRNGIFTQYPRTMRVRFLNFASTTGAYGDGSGLVRVIFSNIRIRPAGGYIGKITANRIITGTLQASETITVVDNSDNVRVKIGNLS